MARAIGLWAEAWTVPGTGTLTKKIAHLPVAEGDWLDPMSETGRGSMALPAAYEDLPSILDPETSEFSMVRIRRPNGAFGGAHVYSWLTRRFEDRESDREVDLANITGPGLEALLNVPILAYDYPTVDAAGKSFDPDWEWGSLDNRVKNPGLEDPGTSIANPSFEDGDTLPWQAGAVDGVSATMAVLTSGGHTGPNFARVTPLLGEGGASTPVNVQPNSDYVWTVWVRADSGLRYQVGASGPEGLRALGPSTAVVEESAGYSDGFEAHYSFLGNGAFQLATLTFRTAPGQTSTQLSIRDLTSPLDLQDFDFDDVGITGIGIGMAPWEPTHTDPNIVSTFEVSQLVTPFEGNYHGHIVAEQYSGGKQQISGVNPGETWTYIARIQGLVGGHRWGIEVKDVTGRIIPGSQVTQLVTGPGTWDLFEITFRMPDVLPRGEVEIWIVNHHTAVSTGYFDGVQFYHGLPAATYGEIAKTILDDLTTNHAPGFEALTFVKYDSFDEVNDSNGDPWATPQSYKAEVGKTVINILEDFAQKGFESKVVDLDGADPTFDVELVIYEPDGLGTDASALPGVAIVAGTNVLPTEIVRSAPVANDVVVQGADRLIVRVEDAASIAAVGRIGAYVSAPELTGLASVTERANRELAVRTVPVSLRPTILESPDHTTPYYDFGVGWTVKCTLPPKVVSQGRRVMAVTGRWGGVDEQATFDVDMDRRVFASNSSLALVRAVDVLWRKFTGRVRIPEPVTTPTTDGVLGGEFTVSVAASDATDDEKRKADLFANGLNDYAIISEALVRADGGLVKLSSGTFTFNSGEFLNLSDDHIKGVGIETVLSVVERVLVSTRGSLRNLTVHHQNGTGISCVSVGTEGIVEDIWLSTNEDVIGLSVTSGNGSIKRIKTSGGAGGFNPVILITDASAMVLDEVDIPFGATGGIDIVRSSGFTTDGKPHIQLSNIHINGSGVTDYGLRIRKDSSGQDYWIEIENLYVDLCDGNNVEIIGVHGVEIANLYSTLAGGHGLYLEDAKKCRISGIVVDSSRGTNNTTDNVHVTGLSSRNWFSILSVDTGNTKGPRYGLFFDTDTFDNIESSDLRDSGRTLDYLDNGTNNRTTDEHMGDGVVGGGAAPNTVSQITPMSRTGVLVVDTGTFKLVWPFDVNIQSIRATTGGGGPTGAALIIDALVGGVSIYPTTPNPQVNDGSEIGALAIPDDPLVTAGTELTIDILQVGSTTPGEDLTVIVEWRVA